MSDQPRRSSRSNAGTNPLLDETYYRGPISRDRIGRDQTGRDQTGRDHFLQ